MSSNTQHLTAWQALSRSYQRLEAQLETALKDALLPPLDVLDALDALSNAPDGQTAKSLEAALKLPQYAVSRLLDRMDKLKLITRTADAKDKRIKHIVLTQAGRMARDEMIKTRDAALTKFLSPRARPGQLDRLTDLLVLLDQDVAD